MSVINGYATLDELKQLLPIGDHADNGILEDALEAASRQIDHYCGWPHGFWADSTVKVREFFADDPYCCEIPEGISDTSGLVVKLDTDLDGTFETTLTISTDFLLAPLNAADETPARPYTEILFVDNYTAPCHGRRPGVQVTAKFGWPAVPDDIKRACLLQAADLHGAKDARFGVAGFGEFGSVRTQGMRREVSGLLAGYVKARSRVG